VALVDFAPQRTSQGAAIVDISALVRLLHFQNARDFQVASQALVAWRTVGLARLSELEDLHARATRDRAGHRWGTQQLNRSLIVALVAQFQGYCRALHDEAVSAHVAAAVPTQRTVLQQLLTQGRKLDTQNPRRATLGSDFRRLGFDFVDVVRAVGPPTRRRLDMLDVLVDYRNAIGHGDEANIAAIEARAPICSTKQSYRKHRHALNGLAGTIDVVVARELAIVLGTTRPW
jgi:hypothetical protein